MPRKLEGDFTHDQMRRAESAAIEVLKDVPGCGPVEALAALVLCLFTIAQQTSEPVYTPQQENDAGILIMMHYQLSPAFPFSNEEIIDEIKRKKAGG
jgi:hypothetical protein